MAKIPLPQRGQPLDLTYIYEVANAVNDISTQISTSSASYVTVDIPGGKQNTRASETRMIAGTKDVVTSATISAGNDQAFYYDFPADFKYPPIVTATLVNVGNTDAGKDAIVILKSITTARVDGIVKFKTSGDLSVSVNLIAIGIPN
jgi:hypothetical protein